MQRTQIKILLATLAILLLTRHLHDFASVPDGPLELISCSYAKSLPKKLVIFTFGQSNAANSAMGIQYKAARPVFSFDWKNNLCYIAQDPLPGTDENGRSVWPRLGDKIVEAGMADSVMIIAAAVSSSYISQWVPGGDLYPQYLCGFFQRKIRRTSARSSSLASGRGRSQ